MKLLPRRFALLALLIASFSVAAHAADADFKPLFNGKDLTGWKGLDGFWSVRDSAITGQTTAEKPLAGNTFLVWQGGDVKNFELRASFRLTGQNTNNFGNSGIQYRSKVLDAPTFVVGGYQMDIDLSGRYTGMLYEEKGRGILMGPGEKIKVGETTVDPDTKRKKTAVEKLPGATPAADVLTAYKIGEWNDVVVIARGNHLQQFLNGKLTAEVTDTDATLASPSGVLALQLHTGGPMTIQFKNIQLKTLP
ncbi:MAG: DUF1080 domain-containing protein [Opitutaceae bacterium]